MSVLGKMKERNVFRVGMAYIVAAWVLVQVMEIILHDFAAPDWILKFVVFLCFAGFPLALWLSWTFALTPEGLRLEKHVDRRRYAGTTYGEKLDYVIIALLAAVVGLVALERIMPRLEERLAGSAPAPVYVPAPVPEPEPEEPVVILENSIAVLPFENMSGESDNEYFSDGLSEELLNTLTRVDGLNVASRTSSFAFKGDPRSIQQIARSLRVANIIEGSVRRVGDRLRVTAQLIDADTDVHLWSDSYDRDMTDIFQVQEEIANAIVAALTVELDVGLQSVNVASATSNLDAYDLYLRGRELFIAREHLPTSWELLQQATHLDPDFARAWETLAAVHSVATSWFPGDGIDHESQALAAARRALELDPTLSMPHGVIGMKHYVTNEGYVGAIASLDQAVANDPRNATAYLWRGITIKELGYLQKALDDFDACLAIDPAYLNCQQWRAEALLGLGRVQEAVSAYEATLPFNFHSASDAFVSYYVKTGQKKMAWLVASLALRKQFAPISEWIVAIENPDADHSAGIARFEAWGATHNMGICDMISVAVAFGREDCYDDDETHNVRLMWHPDTAAFRRSAAFSEWATANALPYWQEHGFPPQCRQVEDGGITCD